MAGEWQHGLFGCFGNCGVCILGWIVPCVVVGRTAEALDDSFCYACLCAMVPLINIFISFSQRGRIREKQGIDGSALGDIAAIFCCYPCAVCQLGAEAEHMKGGMAVDVDDQEMARD